MQAQSTRGGSETIGATRFATLVEGWRERGNGPLGRRLAHAIRSRISSGLLEAGVMLPPERSLALALGVSRSTVVAALDELRASGFVASRQGSGTRVPPTARNEAPHSGAAERLLPADHILNLAASVPPEASQLPNVSIDAADLAAVVPAHGYAPAGLPALREALAQRHHALGVLTRPEQIHVTNGAQHALHLALGALTRRGDVVAIEDPTYVGVFDLLQARGLKPFPIPIDLIDDTPDEFPHCSPPAVPEPYYSSPPSTAPPDEYDEAHSSPRWPPDWTIWEYPPLRTTPSLTSSSPAHDHRRSLRCASEPPS